MAEQRNGPSLTETKRAMDHTRAALAEEGSGAVGMLECRLAGLQDTFLTTPAKDWHDVEVRLMAIREIVAGLGDKGYLFHLVNATLEDVRALGRTGR